MLILTYSSFLAADIDHAVAASSTVEVRFYAKERQTGTASGTVISTDGVLLAPFYLVDNASRITVVDPVSGAEITASVTVADEDHNLALLKAQGLGAPALTFSLAPLDDGNRVFSVGQTRDGDGASSATISSGAIGRVNTPSPDHVEITYVTHNAMIPATGFGGPVLNECGELAGINLPDPALSQRRMRRNASPSSQVFAEQLEVVVAWLTSHSIEVTRAAAECVADVDVAKSEAEQAKEAFEDARTEAEAAQAAADEAGKKAAEAEALAEGLKKKAAAASVESAEERRLREEAEDLATQARDEASRVAQRAEDLAREADAAGAEAEQLQQELEASTAAHKERLKWIAVGIGSAVLLIALLMFWRSRRSRGLIQEAEQRASIASSEAQQARQAASQPPPRFNDCLLEGTGTGGEAIAVRVSGADLAQQEEGLVIGRHLGQAQIIINDPEISRRHARLVLQDSQLVIEDLGSTNGTSVNGRSIRPGQAQGLSAGDSIALGAVKVRLVYV